jgi:hypothetical protein
MMGPFEEHLRDAIRINKERRPRYSALTGGRSLPVSDILIQSEQLSVPFARITDLCSIPFRKKGIRIVELEFISMDRIPPFSERLPFSPPSLNSFVEKRSGRLIFELCKRAFCGGWIEVSDRLRTELKQLDEVPGFHLMLKHILESMLRISVLAPIHKRKCVEMGLWLSTTPLSGYLFISHLLAIPFATWLDRKTAPLLAEGVPILYQDVPAIPESEEGYS